MTKDIEGFVAEGFSSVAEAFEDNVASRGETAAQCCVHVDGELAADLWSGCEQNTIQVVFSATKGATAACANLLVQRGLLELDELVTRYWPEYGANGKENTLVRWMLSHKAGVLAPEPGFTMDDLSDWEAIAASLAARKPAWTPGTAYGYHAHTFGWLVGELVRRVDGRSLGRFFAEEIAAPAQADFWIGLPENEEYRVAPVVAQGSVAPSDPDAIPVDVSAFIGPYLIEASSLNGILPDLVTAAQERRYRAAELGGGGGTASARGLSRLYAWLLNEFARETIEDILLSETEGPDVVLSSPAMTVEQQIGRGFKISSYDTTQGWGPTFGNSGAGGSCAFADPERRIAFGYATTGLLLLPPSVVDPRAEALIHAVYQSTM